MDRRTEVLFLTHSVHTSADKHLKPAMPAQLCEKLAML